MTTATPERADILIRRGYVVTLDPENRVFSDGAIAITGNRIIWIGSSTDAAKIAASETIDAYGGQNKSSPKSYAKDERNENLRGVP